MSEKFEAFGLVELMGHQRVAGRISEQVIGGSNLLRVDVPIGDGAQAFRTVYYGASAIYALHVTGEAEARALARRINDSGRPAYAWEIEKTPALTDQSRSRSNFEDDDRQL